MTSNFVSDYQFGVYVTSNTKMGAGGRLNCLRMLLFAFNFLFWVSISRSNIIDSLCSVTNTHMFLIAEFKISTFRYFICSLSIFQSQSPYLFEKTVFKSKVGLLNLSKLKDFPHSCEVHEMTPISNKYFSTIMYISDIISYFTKVFDEIQRQTQAQTYRVAFILKINGTLLWK